MYQHIASEPSCLSSQRPLSVRLPKMPFNEQAAFVESVCATLVESRFGPGRVSQLVVKLSDEPELEPAVFYDLCDDGLIPCYALSPVGRGGYQVIEAAYRQAKERAMAARAAENISMPPSPANQGRGSP